MSLSEALTEAYAAVDVSGDIYDTLEFNHITLEAPLRFVKGHRIPGEYETLNLPVAGNPSAVFTVVDFGFQRPGQDEGGTSKARIRVDNVSRVLQQALRDAISADQPFSVTYRCYSTNDINHPEEFTGLKMSSVTVNAFSAEGDLYYEEVELQGFPKRTYSLDLYPALHGQ
ncbi:DUF1833 family protein [Bosea sp. FBZP-16]|uniref:DUF1833 family protein n=1 Tax=Bosea sp. FBZP-16 TaxID=2065382 RepID=UPI000C304C17|nr:DUF1833 family protein [Bosea sp. FBZP-16]